MSKTHITVKQATMADLHEHVNIEDANKMSLHAASWKCFELRLDDSCVDCMILHLAEALGCPMHGVLVEDASKLLETKAEHGTTGRSFMVLGESGGFTCTFDSIFG